MGTHHKKHNREERGERGERERRERERERGRERGWRKQRSFILSVRREEALQVHMPKGGRRILL